MLTFSAFLRGFYKVKGKNGAISGYTSQSAVPSFFMEFGLKPDHDESLDLQPSSYAKWVTGDRGGPQPNRYKLMSDSLARERLHEELKARLILDSLQIVLARFEVEIPSDATVSLEVIRDQLAIAVTDQFEILVFQNGTARNLIKGRFESFDWYAKPEKASETPITDDLTPSGLFGKYLKEARKQYSSLKLPGAQKGRMADYYVLSNVGTAPVAFPNRGRARSIDEVSLHGFRHFSRDDTPYVILVGACGYGKTVMLQHLFLEAAARYKETGYIPIFVRLYKFSSQTPDLTAYIVDRMRDIDPEITEEVLTDLLRSGKAQILFDGFDEMNQEEIKHFQELISILRHHYPDNQIVITSRDCSELLGIDGFERLYIHPLTSQQIELLIEKLKNKGQTNEANILAFRACLQQNIFFLKDGFIASNPMLLTIILTQFVGLQVPRNGPKSFYKKLYDTLTKDHDAEKEGYSRVFRSVSNDDEFTDAFREFCAYSYRDGLTSFDDTQFEKYYRLIKTNGNFKNPHAFTKSAFLFDACAKACMMYQKHPTVYYIDEGFQNYFAAEHYELVGSEEVRELGNAILRDNKQRSVDALIMLFAESRVKVETCLILPYLEKLFKGKDEQAAFMNYLKSGFGDIEFTVIDKNAVSSALKKTGAKIFNSRLEDNVISNAIMHLVHVNLMLPCEFTLDKEMPTIHQTEETTHFLTGSLLEGDEAKKQSGEPSIQCVRNPLMIRGNMYFREGDGQDPFNTLRDDDGEPICFGYVYKVNPVKLVKDESRLNFFETMAEEDKVYDMFRRVKQYYEMLDEAQQENQFL